MEKGDQDVRSGLGLGLSTQSSPLQRELTTAGRKHPGLGLGFGWEVSTGFRQWFSSIQRALQRVSSQGLLDSVSVRGGRSAGRPNGFGRLQQVIRQGCAGEIPARSFREEPKGHTVGFSNVGSRTATGGWGTEGSQSERVGRDTHRRGKGHTCSARQPKGHKWEKSGRRRCVQKPRHVFAHVRL
ncbi:hypothetical protein AMTR_s00083p00165120 [Amborella trichopoda]|uniref:Uncharacterized protein n=1 Tax=Amborella trichopoda TaxID=13333 RepID=W1P4F5_AMBTC|nr:hypothetical protein AMTR_s00083p00165120 [Amborella trichopoda]